MKVEYVKKEVERTKVEVGDVIVLSIKGAPRYSFLVVKVVGHASGYSTVDLDDNEIDHSTYSTIKEMIHHEFPNFDEECEVYTVDKMVLKEK